MKYRRVLLLLAAALLFACAPSESDQANMKEKMDLETQQAELFKATMKSCPALASESTAFRQKHSERIKVLDAWWGGLSKGAKDKLIDANQQAWDDQSTTLMQAMLACPGEVKAAMKNF